jgi:putative CocE/NonD family hydrolase
MFGTSYSGFNSLHMAADANPALGAVVAIYATDDRYTDDVHYAGGVLRALDLIDYPLYMVAMNALPPVPSVFGDDDRRSWRDEWRRRIDATPAWLMEWLSSPHDAATWRRGSIRLGPDGVGYERMSCPTMIIAGWADGYRNNTFRVIEQYERNGLPWRLLAGPWVHKSPASARPGPNVDDDVEIITFFDEHLRSGRGSGAVSGQVYVRRPVAPEPDLVYQPGVWRDIATWPVDGLRTRELRPDRSGVDTLVVRGDVGVAAWNSCGGGLPWGQPLDQRDDDARSITYDWQVSEPGEMIGNGTAALRVRSDQHYGHVSVKLCDVFPDGTSALITRGMLDLTQAGSWPVDERGEVGRLPRALTPGEWIDVEIVLEATTWTLLPGHVLRLSVAGTDWPNCWPPPGPVTLGVDAGAVVLSLPIVDGLAETAHRFTPGSGPSADEASGVTWRIERDVLGRETRVVTRYGGTYQGAHGATVTDDYRGELGVSTTNPADAWARGSSSFEIAWPEASVRTESTLAVTSDAERFDVEIGLVVWDGDVELTRRTWTASLPRTPTPGAGDLTETQIR